MNPNRLATLSLVLSLIGCQPSSPPTPDTKPATVDTKTPAATAELVQYWEGKITVNAALTLDFFVVFTPQGAGFAGTMDIPAQNAKALPLSDIVLTDERIAFNLVATSARHALTRDPKDDTAAGTLVQGAHTVPISMRPITKALYESAGRRPQTPTPPFPYTQREVSFTNPADQATLAGTLTLPPGAGRHPAVLLLTGSGAQDRDETIFQHKPFLVIADHLTRKGIAVLRVDDRGIGGSAAADTANATVGLHARDALAGVAFLKTQPEIDPKRIGLIGHSEGGALAPMAMSQSGDVAFIVMLAGPGVPGDALIVMQLEAIMRVQLPGLTDADLAALLTAQRGVLAYVKAGTVGANLEQVKRLIRDGKKVGLKYASEAERKAFEAMDPEQAVQAELAALRSPWFISFIQHDPASVLRKIKKPVLAMIGSLDLQVPAKENLAAIGAALEEAGNTDYKLVSLPGLNHLFQTAKTGLIDEYQSIEETFAPAALEVMSSWLLEHTRSVPTAP